MLFTVDLIASELVAAAFICFCLVCSFDDARAGAAVLAGVARLTTECL